MEQEARPPRKSESEDVPSGPAWSPSDAAERDARIEEYLDRVCAPLVDIVPSIRREEPRAELAAHLDALAAAYQETGSGPDTAVTQALARFGAPEALAREWANEWRRGQEHPFTLRAARAAFGVCTGVTAMVFVGGLIYARLRLQLPALDYALGIAILFGAPVLAGLAAGVCRRGRTVAGALLGTAASLFSLAALLALEGALAGGKCWDNVWGTPPRMSMVWLPLAGLCAVAARWVRHRAAGQRTRLAGR